MRSKWFNLALVMAFALCLLLPAAALADLVSVGDPVEIGSWAQGFVESDVGNFKKMEIIMVSDDEFESPGVSDFNRTGWDVTLFTPDHVIATGTTYTTLTFNINFVNDKSDPLSFDFLSWEGTILKTAANASWSGSKWTISNFSPAERAAVVPLPGALVLLGAGLFRLAAYGRRRRSEV